MHVVFELMYMYHFITKLAYFPGVARVFIYPNLVVICVSSLADNLYAPWRYITHWSADLLLHLRTNYMLRRYA
jgi:hypothetical protein